MIPDRYQIFIVVNDQIRVDGDNGISYDYIFEDQYLSIVDTFDNNKVIDFIRIWTYNFILKHNHNPNIYHTTDANSWSIHSQELINACHKLNDDFGVYNNALHLLK